MSPALRKIAKIILVVGFLIAFFFYVPFGEVYRAILSADLFYFTAVIFLGFPATFLNTLSTWLLARRQGISCSLFEFYIFNLAIRFYGFFSPTSTLATIMRWRKLSAGGKGAEALSAIAFTRALSIFVAISMGVFWILTDVRQTLVNPLILVSFFVLLIVGWMALGRLSPLLAEVTSNWMMRLSQPLLQKMIGFVRRFFVSMEGYAKMPMSVLVVIGLINLGAELVGILSYVLVARALHIPLSFVDLGWLRAVAFLAALAPVTLAGGFGLREATIVVALSAFDVHPNVAAAYSLLVYARSVVFALLCGLIEFVSLVKAR
ncbi:MAG TPA: lysylphosphatidylglycerol synthase domain-containing protein [Anaerolineales bacterium]|nr:lysylphosphatidylglycerol synthase domain-containing protein [Anaerolineales bacterium]